MTRQSFSKKEIDHFFSIARPALKVAGLTFLYAPRQQEHARLLVITPKKVGFAPARNKLRRRLKELFRTYNTQTLLYDIVIVTQKSATNYSFDELRTFFAQAITQIDLKSEHES